MAGRPAPKPDAERRRQNAPTFGWVMLPKAGRKGPTPKLPGVRKWSPTTRAAWTGLWKSPQATMWDPSGRTLWRWAVLHEELIVGDRAASSISSEMRQIEDRHGLSPKALLDLRWRIGDQGDGDDKPKEAPKPVVKGRSKADVIVQLRRD